MKKDEQLAHDLTNASGIPDSGMPLRTTPGEGKADGGERPSIAVPESTPTVAEAELPVEERRRQGIEDNTRHVSSLGRR